MPQFRFLRNQEGGIQSVRQGSCAGCDACDALALNVHVLATLGMKNAGHLQDKESWRVDMKGNGIGTMLQHEDPKGSTAVGHNTAYYTPWQVLAHLTVHKLLLAVER